MPTDGFRQFSSLLRKNLLLKCRRPCATAFEIALPLVLFLLLVYVRSVYKPSWFGPFFYRSNLLSPFGLSWGAPLDSQALRDNGGNLTQWQEEQTLAGDSSSFADSLLQDVMCSGSAAETVASGLATVLGLRSGNNTLAEELLSLDPLAVGNEMSAALDAAAGLLREGPRVGQRLRQDFYESGLDRATAQAGPVIQGEINQLNALLEVPNGHEAGRLAEGWFLSACEANLSGEDINATGLADFLYTLGLAIEDTGLAAFLQVSSQDQVTLTGLMQNFSSASVVVPNATLLEVINNLTQNDMSLSLGELFDQLSGMGESLQAQEGVNFEQVSSLLQALQALNALGLDQSTVQSLLGSMALGSLGLGPFAALSGLSLPTNFLSDPSQILQGLLSTNNLQALLLAGSFGFQQVRDLRAVAEFADRTVWWTSHFLRRDSLTSQLMQPPQGGPRPGPGLPGMLNGDAGEQAGFQTEVGGQILSILEDLQTQALPAILGFEAASVSGLLDEAGHETANSLLTGIRSFLRRITNTSRAEIETSVVPGLLNDTLGSGLGLDCNASASTAGRLMAATHERCPFYRAVVPRLAGGGFNSGLQAALEGLRQTDFQELARDAESFANASLPQKLNETVVEVLVRTQTAFGRRLHVYEVTAEQKYCPEGWAIRTPVECHAAAVSLSKGWLGTVYEEGQPYCRSFNGNVVFNGGGDAAPANFSSVCKAPEELSASSSTKVYELVGAGICRPGSCDSADGACRVGGYFKENLTLTECRSVCDADAGCVGYSHLPGARCEVHSTGPVPADWVPAAGPFSIGDADGSSTAACYREAPVQVQRGWPGGGACFLQQPTRGNGKCGGPHRTWTLDQHGHHFEWAGENEALCLVRKVEHDFYCGTNTTWLFVPQTEAEVPSPRAVSEHITWLMMKEMLRAAELRPCSEPPFERFRWRPHSRGGRRRRDDRRLQSSTTNWVRDNLARRKILVAPYKGEVKQLLDMMVVEALLSGVEDATSGTLKSTLEGFLGLLSRCPLVRGLLAQNSLELMEDSIMFLDSAEEVQDFARRQPDEVLLALVFNSADAQGNFPADMNVDFSIRAHAQLLPSTARVIRRTSFWGMGSLYYYPYLDLGFALLEEVVGRAAARLQAQREVRVPGPISRNIAANERTLPGRRVKVMLEQFPAARKEMDNFISIIQYFMPMFLVLGWIYAVSLLVREVVYEKQEHLKDVMRIQGLKTWVYWLSWLTSGMVQLTGLVMLLVLMLSAGQVVEHSSPSLLFAFFWLYSLSTVSFAMFISSFFSRAKVASAFAGLVYWMAYMPYALYNQYEEALSFEAKNAMCLLSPTALGVGMLYVGKWELIDVGAQWENLWTPVPVTNSGAAPQDEHSLGTVFGMLILDSILYQVLAWYVEKVRPGTLGLPQPWYFPCLPSYWFPAKHEPRAMHGGVSHEQAENQLLECWEQPGAEVAARVSVQLQNLQKVFPNGKQALKGITLDLHQGSIVGLLGHNGAGKSTTMSILTGLYPPSSGDALVHGISVRGDSLGVRRQLGVCLQHNALYENVTVEEHLKLFCLLKAVPARQVAAEVERLLRDTGMERKRRAPSRALSGGMKRKLSIAIALAGGSKVVTLDEPTAGVDATARRDIWHLLVKYKVGRTILLSTHFMDEADILSDRIAIIAEGRLTAIAGSMALKRYFADGYMLTVVSEGDGRAIAALVLGLMPRSSFAGARGRELCFALPFNSRALFPALFDKLQDDTTRAELKINAYGLSAASMEEVFLKASSVHEKGLHGQVRNVKFDTRAEGGDERQLPFSAGEPEDRMEVHGQVMQRDEKEETPKAGASIGATPVVLGLPITDREGQPWNKEAHEEQPASPQCMTSQEPDFNQALQEYAEFEEPKAAVAKDTEEAKLNPPELIAGLKLWTQQFDALFRKRALSVRRDRRAWASQLLMPAIFVFLALATARILEVRVDEPPIKLSTDMLSGTVYAGSTARVIESNKIPFTDELPSPFSRNLSSAFAQGKGDRDIVEQLEPGTRMGQHLLDESHAQELTNSYLALTISAAENAQADLTMWFEREAYHAVPIMVNLWNNARFQLLGMERSKTQVWSHPLPKTQTLVQEEMSGGSQVLTDLFVALTVILAMGFIPASFVVYLVHEKASSGKHQQLLTGISPMMYWFSSYCWDVVNFLVPLMVCLLIFLCFQVMAYSGDNLPAIVLVLFWYGVCMTPLMYCVEPLFRVPSTAYVTLICLNIFTGTISTLAITTLEAFEEELPDLRGILDFGQAVFPWTLPNYALGRSLLNIAVNHYSNFAYTEFGVCIHAGGVCWKDPLSWDVAGQFIFKLAVMAPIWFSLRLLIEWGCFTRQLRKRFAARTARAGAFDQEPQQMDEVVLAESARVARARADYLVLDKLEKSFTRGWRAATFRAVRKISVGVPPGECFGLLGVNGAGKTTTMRMITGDTEITSGDILVGGFSVQTQRDAARRRLGYCPQFDALPDKLTVRETLQLYARIRGVRKEEVVSTADTMIQRMCLEAHQNQLCEFLSGGNKRKLSTALALIGEPEVVLLDEPSTGVDVGARRFLWEVIGDIRKSGHAVVLTSHSMEECEVLCTRLTIMVHGQFRCLGSPIELKARYGGGYSLAVKSLPGQEAPGSSTEQNIAQLRAFVRKQVPWARLAEVSVGLLRYRLGQRDEELPLAEVFRRFEDAKDQLAGCLSDYSVSQTSLEEVFLHFSREAGVVEDPEIAAEDVEERPEEQVRPAIYTPPMTPPKEELGQERPATYTPPMTPPKEPCTIGAPLAAEPEELSMGAPLKDERQEAAIEAEADEEVQARDVIPL